jgi:hypothetical protein
MTPRTYRKPVALLLGILFLLWAAAARAEITIVLQNDFIEEYKRRVTIDTAYTVDMAHKQPNPPAKDGDLHAAGRADEVKLPIVAEIMNARDDPQAVKIIHDAEAGGQKVALSGAWRIWCEHGGDSEQIQGAALQPFTTTNPPHVFEVHPITKLNDHDLLPTLKPIGGFQTKDASEAFTKYEGIRCEIIPGADTTTLVTTMAGYNYVEFIMEINSQPLEVADGVMVMCKVRDLEDELLVQNRRMVLVKDSEVERKTRGKPVGTKLHVLGLPRIDLSLVSWRVKAAAAGRQEVLKWGLPYEIILVGFYEYAGENQPHAALDVPKRARGGRFIPRSFTPQEIESRRAVAAPPSLATQLGSGPAPARPKRSTPSDKQSPHRRKPVSTRPPRP